MRLWRSDLYIDLDRVQQEERVQRREALDRELSGQDARECMDRVRRRMTHGDAVWTPPMYGRIEAYLMWKRRHRKHSRVAQIAERREA